MTTRLRKPWALALLLLCLAQTQMQAAGIKIKSRQTSYAAYTPIVLQATEVTSIKAQFLWDVSGDAQTVEQGDTLYIWAPPGDYQVHLTAIDFETKKVERARFAFTVEAAIPPPGPQPPPGPNPPPPGPTPTPTPVSGLKVLLLYDTLTESKMPKEQALILHAVAVRQYLDAKTPLGADGKTHEWRIWDITTDASGEAAIWKTWLARPRTAVPWIVLGNEAAVAFEGPLPATIADTLTLLSKYAPAARKTTQHKKAA